VFPFVPFATAVSTVLFCDTVLMDNSQRDRFGVQLLPLIRVLQRIDSNPDACQWLNQVAEGANVQGGGSFLEPTNNARSPDVNKRPINAGGGGTGTVNKDRNYKPCISCREKNKRCTIIPNTNPPLCEFCRSKNFSTCDADRNFREQRQEQSGNTHWQSTPAAPVTYSMQHHGMPTTINVGEMSFASAPPIMHAAHTNFGTNSGYSGYAPQGLPPDYNAYMHLQSSIPVSQPAENFRRRSASEWPGSSGEGNNFTGFDEYIARDRL